MDFSDEGHRFRHLFDRTEDFHLGLGTGAYLAFYAMAGVAVLERFSDSWKFILDQDVIQSESNCHMLCHIAKLVKEGFQKSIGEFC